MATILLLLYLTCSNFEQNNSQYFSSVFIIIPFIRTAQKLSFSLQNQCNKLIMKTETLLACCFRLGLCRPPGLHGPFCFKECSVLKSEF